MRARRLDRGKKQYAGARRRIVRDESVWATAGELGKRKTKLDG